MTYQHERCHPLLPAVTFVKHLSECRIWPRAARQQEKPWWGWMRSQDTCHPAVSHGDLAETTADFSLGLQEQLCTEVKSQVSSCCLQNGAVTRSWERGAPRLEAGAAPGHTSMCRLQAAASRTALPFFSTNKMKKLQISYALRLFFFSKKGQKFRQIKSRCLLFLIRRSRVQLEYPRGPNCFGLVYFYQPDPYIFHTLWVV